MQVTISDAIRYIGVDDKDIDLFESQYQKVYRTIHM